VAQLADLALLYQLLHLNLVLQVVLARWEVNQRQQLLHLLPLRQQQFLQTQPLNRRQRLHQHQKQRKRKPQQRQLLLL
jgi:hypothetical protein